MGDLNTLNVKVIETKVLKYNKSRMEQNHSMSARDLTVNLPMESPPQQMTPSKP